MKVEFITPFINAATTVLKTLTGFDSERGALKARPTLFTSQEVNVVCGVTGQIQGQVIFGMSVTTADRVAGQMIGQPVISFDALAASAIAELGNMISGNSVTGLHAAGFECDITPPTIIRGNNVKICTTDIPALVVPFKVGDLGEFEVTVSLRERPVIKAA